MNRKFLTSGYVVGLILCGISALFLSNYYDSVEGVMKKLQQELKEAGSTNEVGSEPIEPAASYQLVVKKSERKLYLYNDRQKLLKTYKIALGFNPVGTKTKQGDGATPEGEYYLTHKNPKSNFYLSLGVSYPNVKDAASGLQRKLISQAQYDAIVTATKAQAKPPQNTKLGGDIFIHGGGNASDWTLGCVALENKDIKELFDLLPVKTPIKIAP
ncbi:MAG TPA: L,D-transpeptidase family protein [Blastocatellia bacterium]|nr:L,D-transpeptidase family protein [Blastocatellia bacterium]